LKITGFIFAAFIVFGAGAFAQDSACPIRLTEVRNIEGSVFISLQNTTDRDITSYSFDLSFVDSSGQNRTFPFPLSRREKITSGQSKVARFISLDALQFLFPVMETHLFSVSFADGSGWNDDGSHSCSLTSLQE
jgi:hypothetical protein